MHNRNKVYVSSVNYEDMVLGIRYRAIDQFSMS